MPGPGRPWSQARDKREGPPAFRAHPNAVARFTPTARAAPEILPLSRSSASKNLAFKSSKSTIPATP